MNQVNPKFTHKILHVGNEKTPVFILDDFLLDTAPAINFAVEQHYAQEQVPADGVKKNVFPGVRANVDGDYGNTLIQAIASVFYGFYKVPTNLDLIPVSGDYSLMTTAEKDMDLLQCIPHFDTANVYQFAVLHYLNEGDFGGTAFYRHIPTGFECITPPRVDKYLSSAQAFIDENGNPEQKYFTQSTQHFELLETVAYKPNRVVIYPSNILHSAFIENPNHDINSDPKTGRLTANIFLDFR